jgi:hypothetical protein
MLQGLAEPHERRMAIILYTCPTTRLVIQVWFDDAPSPLGEEVYEPLYCLACDELHFVDRAGNVMGHDDHQD